MIAENDNRKNSGSAPRSALTIALSSAPFAIAAVALVVAESIPGFSLAMAFGICALITVRLFAKSRGFASLGRKIFFRTSMIFLGLLLPEWVIFA